LCPVFAELTAGAWQVCKDWNTLANADGLWKTQCALRWRQKPGAHLDMVVHFRANLSHPQAVGTLSVAEMKTVLQKRRITERFFEKSDIQAAVARPHTDVVVERAMTSKWKASYAAAEADSRRTLLTLEEICANDWFVFFKYVCPPTTNALPNQKPPNPKAQWQLRQGIPVQVLHQLPVPQLGRQRV